MVWIFLKFLGYGFLLTFLYKCYEIYTNYRKYKLIVKEGAVFPHGFSLHQYILDFANMITKSLWFEYRLKFKGDLPPITGLCLFFGEPFIMINDSNYLDDIYINKN